MNGFLRIAVSLVAGLIFGFGLSLSGMLDPVRVRGFLDIAGAWDPTLMFVLGGAVSVSAIGYVLSRRFSGPAFDAQFDVPTRRAIDRELIAGAIIFGIGWGIAGLCPGPAIASLSLGLVPTVVFVVAMIVGMILHDRVWVARASIKGAA